MEWSSLVKLSNKELKISDYELIRDKLKSTKINELKIDELRNAFECCVNILEKKFTENDEVSF